MQLILAIDIGTSSTRAGLVDPSLRVHALASCSYSLSTPRPGWAEQDLDELMHALDRAVQECVRQKPPAGAIAGVALDCAMHSLVLLDEQGRPLAPLWTWADMRAAEEAARLAQDRELARRLYHATGCPVHAVYFPARIRWLKKERPELYRQAKALGSLKSCALLRLTGKFVEDLAMASTTGLVDLFALAWHPEALAAAGIDDARLLPRLIDPKSVAGMLLEDVARAWGIEPVPVVAGGTDGPFANVGAGAVEPGAMAITVGTSSAVRMVVDAPKLDPKERTWCYYLGDAAWIAGGAINAGGGTLDWLASSFPGIVQEAPRYTRLDELAESVEPGAQGLLFAPYLAGERSPGWQDTARGYMAGIGLHHRAPHFVRAAMEGVAYQIAWVCEALAETAGAPSRIRLTGGLASSRAFSQILADVLGRELEIPPSSEGSLLGSAAFGFAAVDPGFDWRAQAARIPAAARVAPDAARHRRYQTFFARYKELYAAIQPLFGPIAALSREDGG